MMSATQQAKNLLIFYNRTKTEEASLPQVLGIMKHWLLIISLLEYCSQPSFSCTHVDLHAGQSATTLSGRDT